MFCLASSSMALRPWAGTESGSGGAIDFRRAEQVEVVDHLRTGRFFQPDNVAQRHQAIVSDRT